MYSLNVPVPGRVAALATDLARSLPDAHARVRGTHTLGVKRLTSDDSYNRLEARVRELLAGQPAFEVEITDLRYFSNAPTGSSPVVYLAVESPELHRLHDHLTDSFDPVNTQIEGEGYTPHVTVARGGSFERAEEVTDQDIDPITWTVSELLFWDSVHNQSVSSVSLPA